VVNASPLIYLSVLDRFLLLKDCFAQVHVPVAVYNEVVIQGAGLPGAEETRKAIEDSWLNQVSIQNRLAVDALCEELDLGEAEAIVLARELGLDLVLLDDRAARIKAQFLGLTPSGTIGVLLMARQIGVEIDLKRELDILLQHNFRISRSLYDRLTSV
jgi:predicted nucleic acid-binding protein